MSLSPYYQDDAVTIYHGDSLTLMADIKADAVITDPPYGVGVDYDGDYDDSDPLYWGWMKSAVDTMRASAPIVAFTHRVAALRNLEGWDWVYVWNKPNAMSGLVQFPVMPHWEPIFAYGIQGRKDIPRGFDVLSFNPAVAAKSEHPCPKPVELYTALVRRFCPVDGLVLDPFMGSGTTLIAAKWLGLKVIGIDQSERYCEYAARRCAQGVLELEGPPLKLGIDGFAEDHFDTAGRLLRSRSSKHRLGDA